MRIKISLLTVAAVLSLATVAFGGNKADTFSISPMVGGITFEGDTGLTPSPLFGVRFGYNFTDALGAELLFDYSLSRIDKSPETRDYYHYGGELLYHFMPKEKFVPYFAAGVSGINFNKTAGGLSDHDPLAAFQYGLGFKYFVTDDVAWRADLRHVVTSEHQEAIYTVGLYIPIGGSPAVAKLAAAPAAPATVAQEFAPLPPAAPLAGLSASPPSIMKGETSTLNWVSQNTKNCEIQPGIGPVALKGNMPVTPGSTTQYTLNCTGEGGTAKSSASVDVREPAPKPEPPPVVVAKASKAAERFCNKPAILMINFDVDKSDIKPQYHDELKSVGDFLAEFPQSHGEIAGHTDSTHTKAYNQKLSERRASSVRDYIIKNFGIAPERITAKGYGKMKPIATNTTKAGKAKNRRIEANFVCE